MAVIKGQTSTPQHRTSRLSEMGWNRIDEPGCYLLIESGDLVRIPQECLSPGHSPLVTFTSIKEARVAQLSDNPAEPISVLRAVAADNDYFVNF